MFKELIIAKETAVLAIIADHNLTLEEKTAKRRGRKKRSVGTSSASHLPGEYDEHDDDESVASGTTAGPWSGVQDEEDLEG
jgi:DUF4097 and DUF4098 domain-containing protein YvlB